MSTAATDFIDEALERKGQPWVMYPVFMWLGLTILFYMLGGGNGLGTGEGDGQRLMGFNTSVPTADDTDLKQQSIDRPAYGRAQGGNVLSQITNTKAVPTDNQLQGFPNDATTAQATSYSTTSANAANPPATTTGAASAYSGPAAVKSRRSRRNQAAYDYRPAQPYYVGSNQTDAQMEQKLNAYQSTRQAGAPTTNQTPGVANETPAVSSATGAPQNIIQLDDNATASRLGQGTPSPVVENPFNTAPVGGNRQQASATSLQSSGNNRQPVATLIPAVVHDDQSVKAGQTVKLRLTKAIVIDGIRVPTHTIVYATCLPDGDRLRLVVENLQLNGQLIPLNLQAIDMDGGEGVNAPGLSDQLGGQLKSSAVQGVNLPTRSMLVNTVLNAARFSASSSVRQSAIHLKGGYHLYLKSI